MLAIDTETNGVDLRHGCQPFLVTTCDADGDQVHWEWPVDPLTRKVQVNGNDVVEIAGVVLAELERADGRLILQNAKFDYHALASIGLWDLVDEEAAWAATEDTVVSGHVLNSAFPHNLTDMTLEYLGEDILPLEEALEEAVKECRRLVQQAKLRRKRATTAGAGAKVSSRQTTLFETDEKDDLADWRIAEDDDPTLPSGGGWRADYWLPAAYAEYAGLPDDHPYRTVLSRYANKDSESTVALWQVHKAHLARRWLMPHYWSRMQLPAATYGMERRGITYSDARMTELRPKYVARSEENGRFCVETAARMGYDLVLPNGAAVNNSLRNFCFGPLGLPQYVGAKSKTISPSLDKEVIGRYLNELDGDQLEFVKSLIRKRKDDTSLTFMETYRKYAVADSTDPDTWHLYPSINVTGTAVTRMSSARPNEQQISKLEDEEGTTLRYLFGPATGREWWSMDYENIELRIPAYWTGESAMIELFERPDDAPYYGSYHCLNAAIVYPEFFYQKVCPVCLDSGGSKGVQPCRPCKSKVCLSTVKEGFKKKYKSSYYQWVKNGGFAIQYGCQERKADATFRRAGAYKAIKEKMPLVARKNAEVVSFANRHGYVETLPDRTVDPKKGYPVVCSRSERGGVSPTVPFSYVIQGTAGWCGNKALVRCEERLRTWRRRHGFDAWTVLYVHDELVFDFPAGGRANLPRVERLKELMAKSGEDVGIPLKVSVSYHPNNWGEEVKP